MENVISYFQAFDFASFLKTALILLLGTLLLSVFGRFIFGKRSALNHAVSSAIGILFIYMLTVILRSAGVAYESLIPCPLSAFPEMSLRCFLLPEHTTQQYALRS